MVKPRISIIRLNECLRLNLETWDVEPVLGRPGVKKGRAVGLFKNARGYASIKVDGVRLLLHHVVWALFYNDWPPSDMMIDHIDGNPQNNAVWNLRIATHQQNMANKKPRSDGSSLPGVEAKPNGTFVAMCGFDGHNLRVGVYDCPAAAHFAYQVRHSQLNGEFSFWHVWRVTPEQSFWAALIQAGPPSPEELEADHVARFGLEFLETASWFADGHYAFTGPLQLRQLLAETG